MPYDPTFPATGIKLKSAEFRTQFHGLKDLIDAVSGVTSVVVDGVTTLPPGDAAAVSVQVIGNELHFSFGIPRGNDGMNGSNGSDGSQGPPGNNGSDGAQGSQGNDGAQGPPFAQAVVDAVNTLDPGQNAAVNVNFDGTHVHFTFGIPRGNDGNQGEQGLPGEVSQTDLNNAMQNTLSQSSANSNAVSTLDTVMSDPDMETLRQKVDELIQALRR